MNGKNKSKRSRRSNKKTNRTVSKSFNKKVMRKMVKMEIAKNIENKFTENVTTEQNAMTVYYNTSSMKYVTSYFNWAPEGTGTLFNIPQGVDQSSRIGNKIKLKRWIIKGSIYFDPIAPSTGPYADFFNQTQGYVDLYFGRLNDIDVAFTDQLTALYQDGNTSITPTGQILERTYGINKDVYKVYWHKRYKIGAAGFSNVYAAVPFNGIPNNDYKLNREFGFDICRFVCKNKIIKYNDNTDIPNDGLLDSLTLWAVFTQPNNNVFNTFTTNDTTAYAPVKISATSYAEYEDA